ncbi:hypothetical protein AVDCRST_MAG92-2613, partial [uncultured Coleofasciculus sp.]
QLTNRLRKVRLIGLLHQLQLILGQQALLCDKVAGIARSVLMWRFAYLLFG